MIKILKRGFFLAKNFGVMYALKKGINFLVAKTIKSLNLFDISGINLTTPIIKTKVINRIKTLIFTFIFLLKRIKTKKKPPIIIMALFRESKIKFKTSRVFPTIINN